jgi:hypothetical protein
MRVRVLLALAAVAAASLVIVAQAASAATGNAAATQAYVQANYALVRVARSHLAAAEAAPLRVLAQVQKECPRAAAHSPQDPESTQMSDEIIGAMVIAAAQPDLQAIKAFVASVSHLSWSSHALTSAVRSYASDLHTVIGLPAPNLCGEVKAWAANGFQRLPASTVAFVAKFMPAWVAVGYLPAGLSRYESGGAKALAHRSEPLEELLTEGEARAVAHYGEIMDALEVNP